MSEQQKLQTAWQLAKAVQHLHDRHMLHLDIKPQNVLVDDFGDVVLSDVGTTHQMQAFSQRLPSSECTDHLRYTVLACSTSSLEFCCIL